MCVCAHMCFLKTAQYTKLVSSWESGKCLKQPALGAQVLAKALNTHRELSSKMVQGQHSPTWQASVKAA